MGYFSLPPNCDVCFFFICVHLLIYPPSRTTTMSDTTTTPSKELDIVLSNEIAPLETEQGDTTKKKSRQVIHPSPYLQFVLNYPCLVLLISMALVLPLTYFGATNFSLSDPEGGQVVKETVEAEQAQAFQKAAESTSSSFNNQRRPQQTSSVQKLKLYYVAGANSAADAARTTNVLTVANIQKINDLETKLLALTNWTDVCLRLDGQTECAPVTSCM